MAFNAKENTNPNANATKREDWKADAFLNVWLTRPDGSRVKLGAIGLKKSRRFENAIIERLNADPSAIQTLVSKLEIDFQMAKDDEEIDLGF